MNEADKFFTLKAMSAYGGGFASSLSEAWARADANNARRLEDAFPDMVRIYGPGSRFFEAVSREGERA